MVFHDLAHVLLVGEERAGRGGVGLDHRVGRDQVRSVDREGRSRFRIHSSLERPSAGGDCDRRSIWGGDRQGRRTSGGISSFFGSEYPNFRDVPYLFALSCCHFRAARRGRGGRGGAGGGREKDVSRDSERANRVNAREWARGITPPARDARSRRAGRARDRALDAVDEVLPRTFLLEHRLVRLRVRHRRRLAEARINRHSSADARSTPSPVLASRVAGDPRRARSAVRARRACPKQAAAASFSSSSLRPRLTRAVSAPPITRLSLFRRERAKTTTSPPRRCARVGRFAVIRSRPTFTPRGHTLTAPPREHQARSSPHRATSSRASRDARARVFRVRAR